MADDVAPLTRPEFGGLIHSTDSIYRDGERPVYRGDQKRLVETPRGIRAWVTITAEERKRIISYTPKGWAPYVEMREAGHTVEEIAAKVRLETELTRDALALCYGWLEQQLYKLAETKAGVRR